MDPDGKAILDELKSEGLTADDVHTVLLTHGHIDHTSAAVLFKKAKIYVGKEDIPLITGEDKGTGLGAVFARMSTPRPMPKDLLPLNGGETLEVDGEQVKVIAVPGHTDGSRMYLYGDVLFTGDSLQGGGKELSLAPSFFSKDVAKNRKSLEVLKELPFTIIADGHTGATANAREKLKRFLAK
ncbi:MAG: MBL fold metallo-hydrolase [Myxococcaceae bacterium]